MNQKAIVSLGIAGVVSSVFLGFFLIIPWQVAGVLVGVFIGIPTLLLHYERGKTNESISHPKPEERHEENKQFTPRQEEIGDQKVPLGSPLLPDTTKITKLEIDDKFLDKTYEEARSKAVNVYDDAGLSHFSVQVFPFKDNPMVCVYFDFYSKWANRICSFQYSDLSSKLTHCLPNKLARTAEREVFKDLPWKTSPHFLQVLSKVYDRIKPLSSVKDTHYILFVTAFQEHWTIKFEDGLNGNEYWFDWDGKGLNENSIKTR
jgi:hypothetical protein